MIVATDFFFLLFISDYSQVHFSFLVMLGTAICNHLFPRVNNNKGFEIIFEKVCTTGWYTTEFSHTKCILECASFVCNGLGQARAIEATRRKHISPVQCVHI